MWTNMVYTVPKDAFIEILTIGKGFSVEEARVLSYAYKDDIGEWINANTLEEYKEIEKEIQSA